MVWIVRIHTIKGLGIPSFGYIPEELLDYLRQAQERDPTFKFAVRVVVQDDKIKGQHIIIDCPDKTTAYKRGVLLYHRFGAYFEVEFEHRPFGYKMIEGEK
jgi:hypothetical protein